MAEYIGWWQIAKRLGISIPTARKWHRDLGLLVYRRNLPTAASKRARWHWYTNDPLILAWEIAKARVDHQAAYGRGPRHSVAGSVNEGVTREP